MTEVTVEATRRPSRALWLQTMLVTGTRGDQMMELAVSGASLVLSVQGKGEPFGSRVVEVIRFADLLDAWVTAIDAKEQGDD